MAAPARIFPGSALDVPYAFAGWATMRYALTTADGRQLFAGLVSAHQGTLHFTLPAGAGGDVVLSARVDGPLGSLAVARRIAVAPAAVRAARKTAQLPAPRISEFALVTQAVRAKSDLTFAYATNARDGEIWLFGADGRLWASAPMNQDGATTIAVPQGAAGRRLRAVLHARIGGADTLASLGFTVLPAAVPPKVESVHAAGAKTQPPALRLSTQSAAPGETVTVGISGKHGDARVSVTDAAGNTIEQGDIPSGQNAITIDAPGVSSPKTYYVTADVTQGIGVQTFVRKLRVVP